MSDPLWLFLVLHGTRHYGMCRLSGYKGLRPDSGNTCSAGHRVIPALDSSEVQTLLILSASMYIHMYVCVCTKPPDPVV